jgi:hypothetical protein
MRVVVVLLLTYGIAVADPASDLFDEGQRLTDAGKTDEACAKFQASLDLDPAIGTILNLATCREKQGKFLVAHELFSRGLAEVSKQRDAVSKSRASFARERLDAIAKKLVRVRLRVSATENLTVRMRGRELTKAEWTAVHVVEPGDVDVEASAPGRETFRETRVGGAGAQIDITVPELARGDGAVSTPGKSKLPYIVAGVGGGLVVTSIIVGLSAKSDYDDAIDKQPPDLVERVDDARFKGHVATVIGIVGLAGVGAGVYLYIREKRRDPVVVTPTTNGVAVVGRF